MHCNSTLVAPDADRTLLLMRQLSRRSVRHKPDDEFKDFSSWVRRNPGSIGGEHYGAMGQGFWWEVSSCIFFFFKIGFHDYYRF